MSNYQKSSGKKEKFWKVYFRRLRGDKAGQYVFAPREAMGSNIFCILLGIGILLLFFFSWGRALLRWMGYAFGIIIAGGFLYSAIDELTAFYKHYKEAKKKYDSGELEEGFNMYPYEVEPKREKVIPAEAPKTPVFFARDALKELANPLYGHFLGYQTGDFKFKNKYLFLKENEIPVTFSTELTSIRSSEEETFAGYADFLSSFMRVVELDDDDFLQKLLYLFSIHIFVI